MRATLQGQVWCWGANGQGQLGDGTTVDRLSPVMVRNLGADVRSIATGGQHTCAIDHAERVKCWGSNVSGQLSDGTLDDRLLPDAVAWVPFPDSTTPRFAIDCDVGIGGVQDSCSFSPDETFVVEVHIGRAPSRGFHAFQIVVEWTADVLSYGPRGDPSALLYDVTSLQDLNGGDRAPEAVWPGCDIAARAYNAEAGWLAFACVHHPQSELRNDSGPVLEFEFRCVRRGVSRIELRGLGTQSGGTYFIGPVASPGVGQQEGYIEPEVLGAELRCG